MDLIREKFNDINAIKTTTLEEIKDIMKENSKGKREKNDNDNYEDDNHDTQTKLLFDRNIMGINLFLLTLRHETKNIYRNFFFVQQDEIIRFNLDADDIEQIFIVCKTLIDSLIIAKFSSNFYIFIYIQPVFNYNVKEIFQVFIAKDTDCFFQIVLAYQNQRNEIIKDLLPSTRKIVEKYLYLPMYCLLPPRYSDLQNLCFSTFVHHNLYKCGEMLLPARILQNCQIFKRMIDEFLAHIEQFIHHGSWLRNDNSYRMRFYVRSLE